MTIEEAKRRAELYSALAEGKTIQVLIKDDEWKDIKIDELKHLQDYYKYRIKPEPRYRPFKTQEECWNEMHKHSDFGWIVNKNTKSIYHVNAVYSDYTCLDVNETSLNYLDTFNRYEFLDGTPFGIKEK